MNEIATLHRLEGLEPDNLLAFLALLGLLRSLEASDRAQLDSVKMLPRAFWDTKTAPLRPVLRLARPLSPDKVAETVDDGISILTQVYDFGECKDLSYTREEARPLLQKAAECANPTSRDRADLLASLMSDGAIKENKNVVGVDPTPFCLLFGQGHQHFLERLASVPATPVPPPRGRSKVAETICAKECIAEALFAPWHRKDATFSFRWDPEEDVRYALMAGDPTDAIYKGGTQHGANRLAAVGLAVLTVVPETRAGRVRLSVLGGSFDSDGFAFRWPIWNVPATLAGIRGLLAHPDLPKPTELAHLGVEYTVTARRISVGKFMNFARARIEA
jgi:hypothetical protein